VARAAAARLGLPHVEMDSLWWEPNWTEAGADVLGERLTKVVANDEWIVDGNYFSVGAREVVWPRADTIVWLDHSRWVTMPRVVRRTVTRAVRRTELWSGNRESLRLALRPDSIILFAWRAHPTYRRYESLDSDPELAHLTVVRLRRPRHVRQWLASL
jgi:adenylate kinase family enzyme